MTTATRLDANTIREHARGSWRAIFSRLGIAVPATATRHGPCPVCGGKDRFRFDDQDGRGTWFCNQCAPQAGDGFDLVQNVKACDFPQALQIIADALGYHPLNGATPRKIVAAYDYTDEAGRLLFQVVRYEPKDFRQRRPDGHGGWIWDLKGLEPVLYKLPDVLTADHILIVEGEKDVETADRLGLPDGWAATCNPMGAKKWRASYSETLRGKRVVILPDADEPGHEHGTLIAQSLHGTAASVHRLTLPDGCKDLSLWAVDRTAADVAALLDTAFPWEESPSSSTSDDDRRLDHALVEYKDLLKLDLPDRTGYLAWLREGSLVMVFGPRGVGKTMLQLGLAASLTTGRDFLSWPITEPVGVLYVDGEMPTEELRTRLTEMLPEAPTARLFFLTGDLYYRRCQHDLVLTREDTRNDLLALLDGHPDVKVIILDNISCLFPGLDEDKKRDWEPIAAWLVTLRRRDLAVVISHHAGKGGQQRGTSGREDSLDVVIQLSRPSEYKPEEGCHFELSFSKNRSVHGELVQSLDVRIEQVDGRPSLTYRTLEKSKEDQCRDLLQDGIESVSELAEILGVSRGYASKLRKKVQAGGGQHAA